MSCFSNISLSQETQANFNLDSFRKVAVIIDSINIYIQKGQYDKVAEAATQSAATCINMEDWVNYLYSQNLLGEAYFKLSENEKSLEVMFETVETASPHLPEHHLEFASCFNNIASSLIELGQYEKGILYFQKAIAVCEKQEEPPLLMIAALNHNLGSIQVKLEKYEEAIPYLQKGLETRKKFPLSLPLKIDESYNNLAYCYVFLDQPEKALTNYEKTLQIRQQFLDNMHPKIGLAHNNIAKVLEDLNKIALANSHYKKALEVLLPTLGKHHPYVALIKSNYGANQIRQGEYRSGLAYIHWAFAPDESLKPDSLLFRNPSFFEAKSLLGKSPKYLELLAQKANYYQAFGIKTSNDQALTFALKTYLLAAQVIDTFRLGFSDLDKRILANNTLPIYEGGIHAAYNLYRQTGSTSYQRIAFELAEKGKAILLLEGLQAENARLFAGIPPELREMEQSLKQRLFEAKENLRQEEASEEKSPDLHDQIIDIQASYDSLLAHIEEEFPAYYELKYDISPVSISEVQAQLADRKLLVEYFMGEEHVFAFFLTTDSVSFHKLPSFSLLSQKISTFRAEVNLENPFQITTMEGQKEAEERLSQYQQSSLELYDLLLGQYNIEMSGIDQLLIIPDGVINFVPFSALVSHINLDQTQDFRKCAYLLNQFSISYAYSSTLAMKDNPSHHLASGQSYGGFAPTYSPSQIAQSRDNLMDIPMARQEVEQANQIFAGKAFLGQEATKENFLRHAPNYQILHLAMHSVFKENNELESQLVFNHSTGTEDNILSMTELFNLRLPADLVVLSACNSGWGEIAKGEGVMSLARAFAYAGCRSQVISLWKVDDVASSQLMLDFFEAIEAGNPLDEAMQQAQLRYIDQAPNSPLAHPYFWATFDVVGNTDPIDVQTHIAWFLLLGIGGLALVGYGAYRIFVSSKGM